MTDKSRLAEEEFAKAMKESFDKWSKDFEKIGEQIKVDCPCMMPYEDMYPEYGGRMKLNYLNGRGAWNDVANTLIAHGYEVTVHTEVASEVEREVDGVDKWIVIEYGEVE